jgi:MFS family permease
MSQEGVRARMRWYSGLTGYHYLVLVVASMGWMFDTMDQWLYVLARQPALQELLGAGATSADVASKSGVVQAIFIAGWATGGFLFGMVGDRLGRTMTMAITVLIYAIFTGMSGLAQSWEAFAAYRFLTGLGIGGEFAAGAALIAETFPDHARPTALGIMQAAAAFGNVMAGVISLVVFSKVPAEGIEAMGMTMTSWRIIFFVGFLPALLVFAIRLFVKEPDKWHAARAEARAGGIQLGTITHLFTDPRLRRHTFVGVGLAAVGVIGFWGIGTFSPDLLAEAINPNNLEELVKSTNERKSIAVMAQNLGAIFGILLWSWTAERIGRKKTFAATFIACAIAVPATFHLTTSFTMALIMYPIMGFFTTSLFGGYTVYFPELFPTRLRATGTGFCYNVARYIAISGPSLFGFLGGHVGIRWAGTIVSIVFILGLLVLPFAPETKGKPLED